MEEEKKKEDKCHWCGAILDPEKKNPLLWLYEFCSDKCIEEFMHYIENNK